MTLDEYTKWLENRIAVLGTELEVLVNARKAMEMARSELDRKKAPLPQPKPKRLPAPSPQPNISWQASVDSLLSMIRVAPDKMKSSDAIRRYYKDRDYATLTKREKDHVYAVLSFLKQQGTLLRSSTGTWSVSAALMQEASNG